MPIKAYYINKETRERECSNCREVKPFSAFSVNNRRGYLRPVCKECHSEININRYKARRMKEHPDRYVDCVNDECEYVWARIKVSPLGNRFVNNTCPGCGSEWRES